MTPTATASWRPFFDLGVEAYDDGDLAAGRGACEALLARADVPAAFRLQARRNQISYAPALVELVPSTVARPVEFPVPDGWTRFNPSIAADGDGYRLIVRSSNYALHSGTMSYAIHDPDGVIRTTNYLARLDADLAIQRIAAIADETDRGGVFPFPVAGFEDCRLFRDANGWRVTATVRDRNPDGICQVALLRLEDGAFRDLRLLSDAGTGRHEKNWVPLPGEDGPRFLYACRPTQVLAYDDRSGAVEAIAEHPGPVLATDFRGGSQAVEVDGGYLFLIHESVDFPDGGRVCPHRFVLLDRGVTGGVALAAVSPQFFFRERSLEFCAGLARQGNRLVASFGVEDREAFLATMRLDEVLAILRPAPPDAAEDDSPVVGIVRPREVAPQVVGHAPPSPESGITPFPSHDAAPVRLVAVTLAGEAPDLVGEAIRSVVDWVDACLVVDTGAGEATIDAARAAAGAKYVGRSFPWRDDFAASRNAALAEAAALGADWAVVLDTDERLRVGALDVRSALATKPEDVLLVPHEGGSYAKERFFRLPARGRFVGPTHEYFDLDGGRAAEWDALRFVEVPKTPQRLRRKFERDVAVLLRHAEAHPGEARWLYYLGDALQGLGRYPEAIEAYGRRAALGGWEEEAAWACYRAAECWLALGNEGEAVASCAAGLARHAGLAELPWLAAFASWRAGRFAQAVAWARLSAAAGRFEGFGNDVPRLGFRDLRALWEGPYDVLRFALRALGDDAAADEAERRYEEAAAARAANDALR